MKAIEDLFKYQIVTALCQFGMWWVVVKEQRLTDAYGFLAMAGMGVIVCALLFVITNREKSHVAWASIGWVLVPFSIFCGLRFFASHTDIPVRISIGVALVLNMITGFIAANVAMFRVTRETRIIGRDAQRKLVMRKRVDLVNDDFGPIFFANLYGIGILSGGYYLMTTALKLRNREGVDSEGFQEAKW